MSIVVRMTSLARIVLLPLIERILGLRMRIIAKYTYYLITYHFIPFAYGWEWINRG